MNVTAKNMDLVARILFYAGLAVTLLQVWLPEYFLTGDGPCHVYNAYVLHEFWLHKNTSFYDTFYTLSLQPNPNWLSHLVMATLMFVVNGVIAEKLLVTLYVVLFITGFCAVLRRVSGGDRYLPLMAFVFVINLVLLKGFYNFSLSTAFFFWTMEVWLRWLDERKFSRLLIFFLLTLCTYFSHPVSFVYSVGCCLALTLTVRLSAASSGREKIGALAKDLLVVVLCFVPGCVLFCRFMGSEGGTSGLHFYAERYRIDDLLTNHYMIAYTTREQLMASILAWVIIVLFAMILVVRLLKGFRIFKYDGLLAACAVAGIIYLYFPDNLAGGGAFSVRAHYFVFLLGVCCIASVLPGKWLRISSGVFFFICFLSLSCTRLSCALAASRGVADYTSGIDHIKPFSVVLPLDFRPNGKDEHGGWVADANWIFAHASQYMGTKKPLIILDNYECNMGYFPFVWKEKTDPYAHLGKDEGIEGHPPFGDLAAYKQYSGVTVNYILMWNYDSTFLANDHFRQFYGEINADYDKIYTSSTGRTILYEKKISDNSLKQP